MQNPIEETTDQTSLRFALDKTTRELVTANGRVDSLQTSLREALDAHRRSIREAAERRAEPSPAVVALFEAMRPLLDEVVESASSYGVELERIVETAVEAQLESVVENAVENALDSALDSALSNLSVEVESIATVSI